jgi:hypothetical protein
LQQRWHTEVEVVTDENGYADFRGFFGDYELDIEANGKSCGREITHSKRGESDIEITI